MLRGDSDCLYFCLPLYIQTVIIYIHTRIRIGSFQAALHTQIYIIEWVYVYTCEVFGKWKTCQYITVYN